jgi:hypothetical protein
MIDIGVARPSAQGQAMINTVTAATRPKVKRGSGPKMTQAAKARRAEASTAGTNQPETRSARPRHQFDDPRQHGVATDLFGAQHQRTALVDGPPNDARAISLGNRHRFAGHHGFIDKGMSLGDKAVDRNFLAGPHTQAITDRDRIDRDILVTVLGDTPRGFRRQTKQRADCARGAFARPQFQHLP